MAGEYNLWLKLKLKMSLAIVLHQFYSKSHTSAAICQIGPSLTKIGPKTDHFSMQNWAKSGPKCAPNPDQYHRIEYLPASRLFGPYITSKASLNACSKRPISSFFLPFLVKSRLFGVNPDHFRTNFFKKVRIRTKVRKIRTKWEHCIQNNSEPIKHVLICWHTKNGHF